MQEAEPRTRPGHTPVLDALTPGAEEALPLFAAAWRDAGLSAEPADRPRAERAIRALYAVAGLAPPARVVWCGSPLSVELARALSRGESGGACTRRVPSLVLACLRPALAATRDLPPGPSVAGRVRGAVLDAAAREVEGAVHPDLLRRLRATLGRPVDREVALSLGFPVVESLEAVLGVPAREAVYGQLDAGRLALHDFLARAAGLRRQAARLRGLLELARSAAWAAPHRDVCWISERPVHVRRDGHGRLHSERGPAVRFPDGWNLYARAGVPFRAEGRRSPEPEPVPWRGTG